ncbi:calcium-responsive transactivator-like isoform X2 [Scleropages formosus]|uniref:calcium-responsive transactivator-like isoform X2 n=1 Tax=Scleropages formosus TaxID=113540 RepID=UPI000877EE3F|nr:calcium-responsive transactivator isoform X2 [Scleropages formosus]
MSVAFATARPRGKGEVTQQTIQKMLDENHHLIQCIMDYQSKGKTAECTQYQQILHRNLVYLATIADSNQNMQSLLPAPPTQNMNMATGGMGQTTGNQSMHSQSNLNDSMATGLPPTSHMQGQMSNGPSHASMQPSGQTSVSSTSLSMAVSSHSSATGYSHPVSSSQGAQMQNQGPSAASYTSRSNLNMPPNQVTMMHQQAATSHYSSAQAGNQHYQGQQSIGMMGQGSQGNMMAQRPMGSYRPSQQGHGDYGYQQSSYSEQGYERSFDESSQHYYEGGNSQYSQQQASYQQGSNQQQPFSQQQYPSQQGYSGQQQGYGSSQSGSSQYSGYQQGQQYGTYRSSQATPSTQAQRPYGYEQGQYGNYQQ